MNERVRTRWVNTRTGPERGFSFVAALTVFFVVLSLAVGLFTVSVSRTKALAGQRELATGLALTESALHRALYEINQRRDVDGGGLGGVGIAAPVVGEGGEYRAIAQRRDRDIRVVVVAAMPSFERPQTLRAAEVILRPRFAFKPRAAAFSVDGRADKAKFEFKQDAIVTIDGTGERPAFMFTDTATSETVIDALAHRARYAEQLPDGVRFGANQGGALTVVGDPATLLPFELDRFGERRLPVEQRARPTLSAERLRELHQGLVDRAAQLSTSPEAITIMDTSIAGDHVFGSADEPALVVIDPSGRGARANLDGTIRGHGVLIVRGRLTLQDRGAARNVPTIDWHGEVLIVGAERHGRAELRNKGGRIRVDGLLALLGNGRHGEARLRSEPHGHDGRQHHDHGDSGRGSDRGDSGRGSDRADSERGSDRGTPPKERGGVIDIEGALLALAGSDSDRHDKAEIRIRDGALRVDGVLGLIGSRVRFRVDGGHGDGDSDRGDSDRGSDRGDSDRGEHAHDGDESDGAPEGEGQPTLQVRGTFAVAVTDRHGADKLEVEFKKHAVADLIWDEERLRDALEMLDELAQRGGAGTPLYGVSGYVGNYGGIVGRTEVEAAIAAGQTGLEPPAAGN